MGNILACDYYDIAQFNGLQSRRTGMDDTVRDVDDVVPDEEVKWMGYLVHENDSNAAWVQVFFRPAVEVVLGTTPPDFTIKLGADESLAWDFEYPIATRVGDYAGFSVAATTTETGSTAVSTAVTGVLYYKKRPK